MSADRRHPSQSRRVDQVEKGFYRLRLVKGGWAVPCQIARNLDGDWYAVVDGEMQSANPDPFLASFVGRIHSGGLRISQGEYDHLLALKTWAAVNNLDHPCLRPTWSMDVNALRPILPRTRP